MTLNNYRIEDDGIWLSEEELEQMRDHYLKEARERRANLNPVGWYYEGKADFCIDLLKHFETLEGE